jgi:predicted transcriptional regulator
MTNFKERLGLDFLKPFTDSGGGSAAPDQYLDELVQAYTPQVLNVLKDKEPASLHTVVDKANIPLVVANKVVDVLARQHLVEVIERDPLKLDHKIKITEEGARQLLV